MAKTLEPADIVVVRPAGVVMPMKDPSRKNGNDDNDNTNSGGADGWFGDDSD